MLRKLRAELAARNLTNVEEVASGTEVMQPVEAAGAAGTEGATAMETGMAEMEAMDPGTESADGMDGATGMETDVSARSSQNLDDNGDTADDDTETESEDEPQAANTPDDCPSREERIERVLQTIKTSEDRNPRSAKLYNFEYERFVRRAEQIAFELKQKSLRPNRNGKFKSKHTKELIAGGYTQTGKTAYKAALAILGKQCGFTTIIITTTVENRNKLALDLNTTYFANLHDDDRPLCMTISKVDPEQSPAQHREMLKKCVWKNGAIVVNLTGSSINKVRDLWAQIKGLGGPSPKKLNFVVVKDESDAMDRTPEKQLQLEKELERLLGRGRLPENDGGGFFYSPMMAVHISATLVPVFKRIYDNEGQASTDCFAVKPDESYSGLDDMEPLRGEHGDEFLAEKELILKHDYWSPKVERLYKDAHPEDLSQQRRGILLLDAVNPRVSADANIKTRGEKIAEEYPRFSVIVVWGGGGIRLKLSGEDRWREKEEVFAFVEETKEYQAPAEFVQDLDLEAMQQQAEEEEEASASAAASSPSKKRKRQAKATKVPISGVLTAVLKCKGIATPVAVIGYSRMLRGDSYRSSTVTLDGNDECLVPTHVCTLRP